MVSFKYLSNFWRTLETPLTNCEINLIIIWSGTCVISDAPANQNTAFATSDTRLYVQVVTLSTEDDAELLQQLKSGFKCTINQKKYHPKTETLNAPNPYLDYLIE